MLKHQLDFQPFTQSLFDLKKKQLSSQVPSLSA